jgi:hypothetical protein
MVGANPKNHMNDVARRSASPDAVRLGALDLVRRWRLALLACVFVPLSLVLVQCGRAPNPGALAANASAASNVSTASAGDTFDDRFPKPEFRDRFPTPNEMLPQRQMADFAPKRVQTQTYRVASLEPTLPYKRQPQPTGEEITTLVSMKSSAFPYYGNNPASDAPFLNISSGSRKGHRSYSGHVYWQDQTYNDSRVLVHIPENFDVQKPGVIVVFFHGNGATLERDVRDRQLVPQQISDSGVNAVLLAPQMAVDAADSSAGKFWQPGGFKRFMEESVGSLAKLYGDPASAKQFEKMPIVIVGYSGGFLPTAWSLEVGGISDRVRGVILLDAVYGELDKFASWIETHRNGFFVSSYTHYTSPRDHELMSMLRAKGITVTESMDGPLRPGSVIFVKTGEGITHRDYVTQAWTRNPIEQVLVKMAAPSMRVASGTVSPSSR